MTGRDGAQGVSTGGSLISDAKLRQLYINMVHCRLLAEHAAGLRFKARSIKPYEASAGQEAIAAGWVTDLRAEDTIALAPRDSVAGLVKGVPLPELMAQLYAGRKGVSQRVHGGCNVIPASSSLEEQCSAINATAFANKRNKKRPVVVSFVSTSITELAPWQSMLTKAAKQKLPIVFVVENNPPGDDVAGEDFTDKARGYGLTGISVDGNDVVAVYRVAHESLDRVRQGQGPFMVEAKAYSETGRGKRSRAVDFDPLEHMERYLKAKKLFKGQWKDELIEKFSKELKRAAKEARRLTA